MKTPSIPRTEWTNPLTKNIDTWSAEKIVSVMNAEDHRVASAVATELPAIAKAADDGQRYCGGRPGFYVGAGTSGRIAVLDASELEPTYGAIGKRVIAIMSGGREASPLPLRTPKTATKAVNEIAAAEVGSGSGQASPPPEELPS